MRAKGVKGQNTLKQHGFQGRIQDFPKGGPGVETRDTKCWGGGGGGGGGGVLST